MWACVRITASSFPAVQGSQFRRRRSLRPWNRPASIRMRLPDEVVRRWREPVTVRAAPRKVSETTAAQCHIRCACAREPQAPGARRTSPRTPLRLLSITLELKIVASDVPPGGVFRLEESERRGGILDELKKL